MPGAEVSSQHINKNREHNDCANQDLLPERANVIQVKPIFYEPHYHDSAEYSQHMPTPTKKTRAAYNHSRNGLQLHTDSGIGKTRVGSPSHDQAGNTSHQTTQGVNNNQGAVDTNAADPDRLRIAANCIDSSPKDRVLEQNPECKIDAHSEQKNHREVIFNAIIFAQKNACRT